MEATQDAGPDSDVKAEYAAALKARRRFADYAHKFVTQACLTITLPDGGVQRVWADGRVEGFPEGAVVDNGLKTNVMFAYGCALQLIGDYAIGCLNSGGELPSGITLSAGEGEQQYDYCVRSNDIGDGVRLKLDFSRFFKPGYQEPNELE